MARVCVVQCARRVVVHGFSDTVCAEEGCRAAN